ncbi:hypothetical protein DVH24_010614 [Malus domestica]|uniref:Uncharacterized protein n=1 Tax=Malus domestica TaxID=3750 RepID=A0A498JQR5_MALDO|nr:hypothetical protein DVH24_010614 [Malus domestica]
MKLLFKLKTTRRKVSGLWRSETLAFRAQSVARLSLSDQAFFLLAFIARTAMVKLQYLFQSWRIQLVKNSLVLWLPQEIADGVSKSTQAVQAAEAGILQIAMIQERASLPIISLQPAVVGAAKKTSLVVGQATRNLINKISRRDDSENEDDTGIDRSEI